VRTLSIFIVLVTSLAAQNAAVRITNASRPGSTDFQVGDRFEIVVTGAPNLPVSVRTMRQGRTDWGPVIAHTDAGGRWSTEGQFEKQDFGAWSEVWTVGGKAANPVVSFWVTGPCIPGGHAFIENSGPNMLLSCETVDGQQSFGTPSGTDPFRTPDGRIVSGRTRSAMPAEEYRMEIMESMMGGGNAQPGKLAAEAGDLIMKMIGVNALTDAESRTVLSIVRAAFEQIQFRAGEAEKPAMLLLLQHLEGETDQASLKRETSELIDFVRVQ
jgi:hypothetical protein